MKSLTEVVENLTPVQKAVNTLVSLPSRTAPLAMEDVVKLQAVIDKHFKVTRTETYGYVPVIENGKHIRDEYDATGELLVYEARDKAPQSLWEALIRPARTDHIIYHLGRLAAHRRDTRGDAAFQVVIEDVAFDLAGTSEWAVIMGCSEMRRKNATWYPNTGEIMTIIKKYSAMIDGLYLKRLESKPSSAPVKRDMKNYYLDHRENPVRRTICDFIIAKGGDDHFDDRLYSNYQLEIMAASKYGYKIPHEEAA